MRKEKHSLLRFDYIVAVFILVLLMAKFTWAGSIKFNDTLIVKSGIQHNRISDEWEKALVTRMSSERIDQLHRIERALSAEEQTWQQLITSKAGKWNGFKDSLAVPFTGVKASDTIYVLLGYNGTDDGFTYGYQTVCLDLTALHKAYGKADLPVNDNRIDRIFSHEYTHLLHKLWAAKNQQVLYSFRDSILWECLYEGIGMYRSLHPRWLPVNGQLPELSKITLEKLAPVFAERLVAIKTMQNLSDLQKEELHKNLSRGNVDQKWGAFPVAIWLALEADGDDEKLRSWINKGPAAVIQLAKKYLPPDLEKKFSKVFR